MEESSESRKFHGEFQRAIAPYEGMMRAEGAEPLKAVASLLQTAAALRTASPAHKAQLVASMVRTFSIPIDALDAALVGEAPAQGQGQAGGYRDPRVDQLFSQLQEANQRRSGALSQSAAAEVQAFEDKEFFDDVREDVADILEMSAKRNVAMSLEQAYSRAVRMHPEISQVLQQREAAKAAGTAQAATQQARRAASSVKGSPSGVAANGKAPNGLREELEASWDAHQR
jgi:hypothetical protein